MQDFNIQRNSRCPVVRCAPLDLAWCHFCGVASYTWSCGCEFVTSACLQRGETTTPALPCPTSLDLGAKQPYATNTDSKLGCTAMSSCCVIMCCRPKYCTAQQDTRFKRFALRPHTAPHAYNLQHPLRCRCTSLQYNARQALAQVMTFKRCPLRPPHTAPHAHNL